jgi:predicted GNAT family N-acyltransferase
MPQSAQIAQVDMELRLASSAKDREAAFRLRYDVYIAEQGKPYPGADHDARVLTDELDVDGDIFIVDYGGDIVGTVRANWFNSPATARHYARTFELERFPDIQLARAGVCTRLAASIEHRHAQARRLLFDGIYEQGVSRTSFCFAACASRLVRLFRRYGFREYAPPIHDPVVGPLHRTLLVVDDLEHLMQVDSPFAEIAARRSVVPVTRPWLDQIFLEYSARHA